MRTRRLFKPMEIALSLICVAALLVACGGGGGGSSSTDGSPATPSTTGSVAVLVTDGPSAEMDELWLTITKVSLIPAGDGPEVVIHDDPGSEPVNVLAFRKEEEPYLLTLQNHVPAGSYSKIRLEIENIDVIGAPCDGKDIKLPSGKIDLNPRGGFNVSGGETIAIQLDFDANKWINLHAAGNSGKCILRPVIFVDIYTIDQKQRCPKIIKGTVETEPAVEGDYTKFLLKPTGNRGAVWVFLDDSAAIIDANGQTVDDAGIIQKGDTVFVRGRLTHEGILASLVVEGQLVKVSGTASGAALDDVFPFTPDSGEEVFGDTNVQVTAGTLILLDCNTEGSIDDIGEGTRATVIGKLDSESGLLVAVAVLIESTELNGELTGIESSNSELPTYQFSVTRPDASSETVIVSEDTPIYLMGNGALTVADLQNWVGCDTTNPQVRILVDPGTQDPKTALKIMAYPEEITGTVVEPISEGIIYLKVEGETDPVEIEVANGAKIISSASVSSVLELKEIETGASVTVFGIPVCTPADSSDPDFVAHVVVLNGSL